MNPESAPSTEQPPATQPISNAAVSEESSGKKPLVIIFIMILLLGIGAFYYFMVRQENNSSNIKPADQVQQPIATASPTPTPTPTIIDLDSSDTQLDKDIQSINNKANNLGTDINDIDKSLNDKPLDNGQ